MLSMAQKKIKTTSPSSFYTEYKGDIDIFVPHKDEEVYIKNHQIEIRHLPNGAYLFGATRELTDRTSADVKMTFPSGAYHEPKQKSGINHLIEHMISNVPLNLSR